MEWWSSGVLESVAEMLTVNPHFGQVQFGGIFGTR
jgi:hypothetical protein